MFGFVLIYPYNVKWANAFILALCVFALFSNSIIEKISRLKETKGLVWLPIYFVLLAIGVLYSDDIKYSFSILERSLVFLGGPLLIATGEHISKRVFVKAAWIFILNTTAAALYCIVKNIFWFRTENVPFSRFFDWEYTYEHLAGFIGLHPTYFSMMVLISVYFLIFLPSYRSLGQKILNVLLIGFLVAFLILLGTKIGVLILFLFGNIALIIYLRKKKKMSLLFGYIFFNALALTIAFKTHVIYWRFRMAYETFKNTLNGNEMSDYRILHWKCAAQAIREKPLFGWGTGDSYVPLDACYREMKMDELLGYNAHNQFLETWIKIGFPGVLILALTLLFPLYVSIRNRHYLFISIFSMYFLIALTECIFSVQKGIALFSIISSIYLGHICITNQVRPKDVLA